MKTEVEQTLSEPESPNWCRCNSFNKAAEESPVEAEPGNQQLMRWVPKKIAKKQSTNGRMHQWSLTLALHFTESRPAAEKTAWLGRRLPEICSARSEKTFEQFCPVCWTCQRSRQQETQSPASSRMARCRGRRCQVAHTLVLTVFNKRIHKKVFCGWQQADHQRVKSLLGEKKITTQKQTKNTNHLLLAILSFPVRNSEY